MDKYAKLAALLKGAGNKPTLPMVAAEVKSIEGESCTVIINYSLELTDVRLKATINGESNKLLLIPKIGTRVLLGSLTGDLKDLAILKVDELETVEYEQDGLTISIDAKTKKVSVKNESVSLIGLMQSLADILKNLKVNTPSGASVSLLPDSLQAVIKFETDFKKLLK